MKITWLVLDSNMTWPTEDFIHGEALLTGNTETASHLLEYQDTEDPHWSPIAASSPLHILIVVVFLGFFFCFLSCKIIMLLLLIKTHWKINVFQLGKKLCRYWCDHQSHEDIGRIHVRNRIKNMNVLHKLESTGNWFLFFPLFSFFHFLPKYYLGKMLLLSFSLPFIE